MSKNEENENYLLRKQDIRKFCSDFIEWLNKPLVSPLMVLFLIGIVVINILINSVLFTQIALISLVVSILLYLPIVLVKAKQKSGLLTLVGKILDILIEDDESDEQKVAEMENAVMLMMLEINKYYEKKLKQFKIYLKKKKEVKQNV